MPDPDRLLSTLRKAIQAFRDTPGRRGRSIVLTEARDVLATGDLHGNVENFRQVLHKADLGNHPGRQLVLQEVIHGPFRYAAGGDKSHQLLDLILRWAVVSLRGDLRSLLRRGHETRAERGGHHCSYRRARMFPVSGSMT
jgi:hypothetical protein